MYKAKIVNQFCKNPNPAAPLRKWSLYAADKFINTQGEIANEKLLRNQHNEIMQSTQIMHKPNRAHE